MLPKFIQSYDFVKNFFKWEYLIYKFDKNAQNPYIEIASDLERPMFYKY